MRSGSQSVERALAVLRCLAGGGRRPRRHRRRRAHRVSATAPPTASCRRCAATGSSPRTPARERYHLGPGLVALGRRAEARVRFDRLLPRLDAARRDDRRVGQPRHPGRRRGARSCSTSTRRSRCASTRRRAPTSRSTPPASARRCWRSATTRRPRSPRSASWSAFTPATLTVAATRCSPTSRRPAAAAGRSTTASATSACARWPRPLLDDDGRPWAGVAIQGPTVRLPDDRLDELAAVLANRGGGDGRGTT